MAKQQDWWKENKRAVIGLGLFGVLFLVNLIVRFTRPPVTYEDESPKSGVVTNAPPVGAPAAPGAIGGIASGVPIGEAEMKEMDRMSRDISSLPVILRLPSESLEGKPLQRDPFRWGTLASPGASVSPLSLEIPASGPVIAPPEMISSCRSGERFFAFVKYQKTIYFLGQNDPIGNAPFRLIEGVKTAEGSLEGVVLEWSDRARTVALRRPGDEIRTKAVVSRLRGAGAPLQWQVQNEQETATPTAPVKDPPASEVAMGMATASEASLASAAIEPPPNDATEATGTLGMASLPPLLPSEPLSVSKLISHSSKISSAGAQIEGGKR